MSSFAGAPPRLFVGIMVDGLDENYLDLLAESFGDGGFRRLRGDALAVNADYGTPLDATAAATLIFSGASPSASGIGGDMRLDRNTMRAVPVYGDGAVLGNFSSNGYSARALRVTNLSDESRISSGGTNVACAVAATPGVAVAMAGHAASTALWLDRRNAAWASSTAYGDIPATIASRNRTAPLNSRMDTMSWTPLMSPDKYPSLPDYLTRYPFRYVFPRSDVERFDMFCASPAANREVTDVALELIARQRLGQHEGVTDMINVAYTLRPITFGKSPDKRYETMDAYLRLDGDIGRLLSAVDSAVGAENAVIMLAATPPPSQRRREDERWNLPAGEFSPRKAASLLNLYLIAIHGNGAYVSHYHDHNFYLNRKLIDELKLDAAALRAEAATLLVGMTGVERAHTLDDILAGRAGEKGEVLRRNTVADNCGDVVVDIAPGFEIVDDYLDDTPKSHSGMVQAGGSATAPAYIVAPGVAPGNYPGSVDARVLAPTVSRLLRMRAPNGAALPPLR